MPGINPCFDKQPEEDRDFLVSASERLQKGGMDAREADIRAVREFQEKVLDDLHDVYNQIGVSGYEKSISSLKIDNNGKSNEGRQQESGSKETIHEKGEGKGEGQKSLPGENEILTSSQKGTEGAADDSASSILEKKEPYQKQIEKSDDLIAKAKSEGLDAKAAFEGKRKKIAENNIKLLDKFGLDSNELVSRLREEGRLETRNCA